MTYKVFGGTLSLTQSIINHQVDNNNDDVNEALLNRKVLSDI